MKPWRRALGLGFLAAALLGCGSAAGAPDAGGPDGGTVADGGAVADGGTVADGGSGADDGSAADGGAGSDGGTRACGTRGAGPCAADEWCDFAPSAACGATDQGGTCEKRPTFCTQECPGTCGCDGRFYCNPCLAHAAGTDDTTAVSCSP